MFGLTGHEGNHGEDVKECYFYLDNVPSHSYMKMLYKYPQRAYPYADLVTENRRRTRNDPEYELLDTGIFDADRYFDVFVEYAKAGPDDILIRIRAVNRGPDAAPLHLLPTLWFRNDWSWYPGKPKPRIAIASSTASGLLIDGNVPRRRGVRPLQRSSGRRALHGERDRIPCAIPVRRNIAFAKDAFDRYVVHGDEHAVNRRAAGRRPRRSSAARSAPAKPPSFACASRALPTSRTARRGVRRDLRIAPAGSRRVLPARDAVRIARGHAQRAATGVRRDAVVEAALPLFGASLARGDASGPSSARGASSRPQS
jgi:hypothetical protein